MNPKYWAAILAAGAALDYWAATNDRQGDSLSEYTRAAFHTHTKPGRFAFTIACVAVPAWFWDHCLNDPDRE